MDNIGYYLYIGSAIGLLLGFAFICRHDIMWTIEHTIIGSIKQSIKSRKEKKEQYLKSKDVVMNKSFKCGKNIYLLQYTGLNSKDIIDFIYYFTKCMYIKSNDWDKLILAYPSDKYNYVYLDLNCNDYIAWCDNKIERIRENELSNFYKERNITVDNNKQIVVHIIRCTNNNVEDVIRFLEDHGIRVVKTKTSESTKIIDICIGDEEPYLYLSVNKDLYIVSATEEVFSPGKYHLDSRSSDNTEWKTYFNMSNASIVNMRTMFRPDVIVMNSNYSELDDMVRKVFTDYDGKVI